MTSAINIYTAYYTDSKGGGRTGAAFAAIIVMDEHALTRTKVDTEATYMMMWMESVAGLIERSVCPLALNGESLEVNIIMWHKNIQAICAKMVSICKSLQSFSDPLVVDKLLERKLLRTNLTKYEHHDYQRTIVKAMLACAKAGVTITFSVQPPTQEYMASAYQLASMAFEEAYQPQEIPCDGFRGL